MFVARHMKPRLHIDRIEFTLHAERDPRGATTLPLSLLTAHAHAHALPARLARITGNATVFLKAGKDNATQAQIDELEMQVSQRCPVANMVHLSGCRVHVPWVLAARRDGSGAGAGAGGVRRFSSGSTSFDSTSASAGTGTGHESAATTTATAAQHCWRCGLALQAGPYALFCTSGMHAAAGHVLQPLRDQKVDYFSLFEIPKDAFLVDSQRLEQRFKALQKLNHPDKYAASHHDALPMAGPSFGTGQVVSERSISAENSSYINQAYQVLRSPIDRAAYMLQSYWGSNILSEESGTHKDAALALEVFELREELADLQDGGDVTQLREFKHRMQEEQMTLMQAFHDQVQREGASRGRRTVDQASGVLLAHKEEKVVGEKLAACAVKLKYVTKILEEIDK